MPRGRHIDPEKILSPGEMQMDLSSISLLFYNIMVLLELLWKHYFWNVALYFMEQHAALKACSRLYNVYLSLPVTQTSSSSKQTAFNLEIMQEDQEFQSFCIWVAIVDRSLLKKKSLQNIFVWLQLDKFGYLSSRQALGDYANLLTHIKSTFPGAQNSPVITFGGSYGAILAAWARVKYPHIFTG